MAERKEKNGRCSPQLVPDGLAPQEHVRTQAGQRYVCCQCASLVEIQWHRPCTQYCPLQQARPSQRRPHSSRPAMSLLRTTTPAGQMAFCWPIKQGTCSIWLETSWRLSRRSGQVREVGRGCVVKTEVLRVKVGGAKGMQMVLQGAR